MTEIIPDHLVEEQPRLGEHRYQTAGARVTLRPGDPSVFAYRITREQWLRMINTGALGKYDQCELLEGTIVGMPKPVEVRFHSLRGILGHILFKMLPERFHAFQNAQLDLVYSMPMAELAIFTGDFEVLRKTPRFAHADEIGIVVEIGEQAIEMDRTIKQRIYAGAGIPEYWILNPAERCLEVYRRPLPPADGRTARYETVERLGADDSIEIVLQGESYGRIDLGELLS